MFSEQERYWLALTLKRNAVLYRPRSSHYDVLGAPRYMYMWPHSQTVHLMVLKRVYLDARLTR